MPLMVTIDGAGRLVVPLPVRRRLHLVPGSRLRLTEAPESIILEPEDNQPQLAEKHGILVVGGQLHGDMPDHRELRQDRIEKLARR